MYMKKNKSKDSPPKYPIIEWFKKLPEPQRTKAMRYCEHYETQDDLVDSMYDAFKHGFVWNYTKEENEDPGYWARYSQKYIKEKLNK